MGRLPGSLNKKTIERMKLEEPVATVEVVAAEPPVGLHEDKTNTAHGTDGTYEEPESGSLLSFVEYNAPGGDRWRAEGGAQLCKDFDIAVAHVNQLEEWHATFAPQEQMWLVLRRIYTVAPLLGESTADDLRRWTAAELALSLGLDEKIIEGILSEARLRWRRARVQSGIDRGSDRKEGRSEVRALTTEEVEKLVMRYGFNFISDEEERRWVANRCRDLEPYLEDEGARSIARNAIQQELHIYFVLDRRIQRLREIEPAGSDDDIQRKREGIDDRILELIEARQKAVTSYENTRKTLGDTPAQRKSIGQRMEFHDCMSGVIEAVQEYYSNDNHALIDGLYTAAEVELLLKETSLRPAQYRADVVFGVAEAKIGIWDKEWELKGFPRESLRKLLKGFRSGIEAMRAEDGEMTPDMEAEEDAELAVQKVQASEGGGTLGPGMDRPGDAPVHQGSPMMQVDDVAVI